MSFLKISALVSVLIPLFASCSFDSLVEKFVPKVESEFAKEYLEDLRNGNLEEVKRNLGAELLTPEVDTKLVEVAAHFPTGALMEIKTVGCNTVHFSTRQITNLTYQYHFENGWALVSIGLLTEDGRIWVKGFQVNGLQQSLEKTNAFTFTGKTVIHYFFLILVFAIPVFIVCSLVSCLKTPMKRRKWLWILFILIGCEGIHLNWTTGQVAMNFFSIHLFGAGAIKASPYAPWIMTISIPLGAILFLVRRESLTMNKSDEETPAETECQV